MAYVYRHIRLDKNVPFYIGIGSDAKYRRAFEIKRRNIFWERIVNKTEYLVEILFDNISNEFAKEKEKEFIQIYGRSNKNTGTLCNLTDGGDGMSGYICTNEHREKLRIQGKNRVFTEDRKQKIREKSLGRKPSIEARKKMSEKHKKNNTGHWLKSKGHENGRAYKVEQLDLEGNLIKVWDCCIYASNSLSINKSSISSVIKGRQKTAGGFLWKKHQ